MKDGFVCYWFEIFQENILLFPDPKPNIIPVLVVSMTENLK